MESRTRRKKDRRRGRRGKKRRRRGRKRKERKFRKKHDTRPVEVTYVCTSYLLAC